MFTKWGYRFYLIKAQLFEQDIQYVLDIYIGPRKTWSYTQEKADYFMYMATTKQHLVGFGE